MRPDDVCGFEARIRCESEEKRFVSQKVIEHAAAKARISGGSPQIVRAKPGRGQKSFQALRIGSQEGQGRDRHR
jgi:hypothetical protein